MEQYEFENIAERYDLPIEFVTHLYDIITDKENFERAIKMFVAGTLKYEKASGDEPICIADIRKEVANNFVNLRKTIRERLEKERAMMAYFNGCKKVIHPRKHKPNTATEVVYIDNGIIVGFAHFEPNKQGGFYAANCDVLPDYHWTPKEHLARFRKYVPAYYREIKKAASNSPREWFGFSGTTIVNKPNKEIRMGENPINVEPSKQLTNGIIRK